MNLKQLIEKVNNAELVLVRGLPGSGKTTYVKKNLKDYKHYEADQFFMKNGKYEWKQDELGKAHNDCFNKTKNSLMNGDNVVVSNTFTTQKEVNRYTKMATDLGIKYRILRTTKQFENQHNVSSGTLERMKKKMADIAGEVKI